MDPELLLEEIGKRGLSVRSGAIALAKDYLSCSGLYDRTNLQSIIAGEDPSAMFRNSSGIFKGLALPSQSFDEILKQAGQTLVFRNDEMLWEKKLDKASEGACLDFECCITTSKKDRDGDILECSGAEVDPQMPLLWQHMPAFPIGKLVRVLSQNSKRITGHFAVIDNAMGRDAAQLIEFGALRISHGFKPKKVEPLEKANDELWAGYRIISYKMFETSAVSVPANEDATITAFSRSKLTSPVIKGWAEIQYRNRPAIVKSGWDPNGQNAPVRVEVEVSVKQSVASVVPPESIAIVNVTNGTASSDVDGAKGKKDPCPDCKGNDPDCKTCGGTGEIAKKKKGQKSPMSKKRLASILEADKMLETVAVHKELEGATVSKSLLAAARTKLSEAVAVKKEDEEDDDDEPGQPNPEVSPNPNPGIDPLEPASTDAIAQKLLVRLFKGQRPGWDAMHALRDQLDVHIQLEEQKAFAGAFA